MGAITVTASDADTQRVVNALCVNANAAVNGPNAEAALVTILSNLVTQVEGSAWMVALQAEQLAGAAIVAPTLTVAAIENNVPVQ